MLLISTVLKKCKICLLTREIRKYKKKENTYRYVLMERSQKYHNGRLEIDSLLENEINKGKATIFRLKRGIVKEK
jgi:hypothetical protein